ncbi:glycerol-3-phosphate 1-O-acyltransferase PlsY [Qipengyuania aquimaris]|uniref:Glycerol-3-phosphate acyltransferase n=1 Tax=Qipengyuania aquimaris TaxID=255984 RepID=A0A9Q3RZI8_9SPHN|nr:glycerol-3-phosphate 1-O-acyltransferase PlsY [Qipengyuania aquimaris]MBY6217333.1 glycerol-3-phosphate 1-O-acyltransferase PlsY [Qipengyuania aquimaris]UOR14469.1 glycerol-3-phosphate 1-O-acyltransferase PlsY [Qipengyuania aquimaris]
MDFGTDFTINVLWAALLGYAFGSIPFGLILAKLAGKGDIRQQGSGNIGATNVLRTGSKGLAAATLLLDLAKGLVPVLIAWNLFWQEVGWTALFAVIGHCFPVWLGFKGGKGVATNAGVAFGLAWPLGAVYAVVWLGMLAITRISSVAGMSAVVATALAAAYFQWWTMVKVLSLIAVLVIWLHRENIKRLAAGTEPKVGSKG